MRVSFLYNVTSSDRMEALFIAGIDIGTGSIKAVVLDQEGKVIITFQEYYTQDDSTSEQDVDEVYNCFKSCLSKIIESTPGDLSAVCLGSAMHSVLAVDGKGRPLMKAILWSDGRSSEIAESLRATSLGEHLYLSTGTPIHSMSPLCKLKWLYENDRSLFDNVHKFISIKEYIWYKLFGEFVIDYSIASATGLFNFNTLEWNSPSLNFIPIHSEKLSSPVPTSYSKTLTVSNEFLTQEIKLIIGASDGCFANLGSLCFTGSEAAVTIGTSGAARITSTIPILDYGTMNFSYILENDLFVCGGPSNNGGNIIEWLINDFVGEKMEYEQLFSLLNSTPAGAEGMLFLPYLNGERAPVWDEKSRGVFFGVKAIHTKLHFIRAAIEGLCYGLRQILESIEKGSGPIKRIKVSGGISSSMIVMQILADITGKEVVIDKRGDASAIGAAYFAMKTIGWIKNYKVLNNTSVEYINPRVENFAVYNNLYSIFKQLYPALKFAMHAL
jgi:gluconokinase